MSLLIDGYNLLYAIGVVGPDRGPIGLERSRRALLQFLATALTPAEAAATTIVFDAADAPPNLPRRLKYAGISVEFAPRRSDADTVLEDLIRANSAPRRLTVVSSDHRVQRAARRRRATAVDSDRWYAGIVARLQARRQAAQSPSETPAAPALNEDTAYWLAQFRDAEWPAEDSLAGDRTEPTAAEGELDDLSNPFPPGYGEDILPDGFS